MKRVAVTQRSETVPDYAEERDALDQRLAGYLYEAGGLAFPIPGLLPLSSGLQEWLAQLKPDAVLLSGGNDIGQCPARDRLETELLAHARRMRLPVLGICRGMQMLAYDAGVSIKPVVDHIRTRHRLLGEIGGEVNSYHAFSPESCPEGFTVLARSEDGEIEAIRHSILPWEGWMWHPERESSLAVCDIERLRRLIHA